MSQAFMRLAGIFVLSSGLVGCGSVYFHSNSLATSYAPTDKVFAEASYTKVYDDELARLADARSRENVTIARLAAAQRDSDLQTIAGAEPDPHAPLGQPANPADALRAAIQADWEALVGFRDTNNNGVIDDKEMQVQGFAQRPDLKTLSQLGFTVARRRADVARGENYAEDQRRAYRATDAAKADTPPRDLSCKAMLAGPKPPGRRGEPLVQLHTLCGRLAQDQAGLNAALAPLEGALDGSEIDALVGEYRAAVAQTRTDGADAFVADLSKQIEAAKAVTDKGAVKDLNSFREDLHKALDKGLSPLAKAAGLDELAQEIDEALIADVCAAKDSFDKAIVDAAKCGTQDATSTTAKADAVWSFLEALAQLSDATDPRARSASWLAGAKAIVDAAKADAKLEADQAKAVVTARGALLDAAIRQTAALASAQLALDGFNACTGGRFECGLVYFVESRNSGAIPRALLTARPLQIEIEYAVRRERRAAETEGKLIQAASAQIKAYVDGGVDPALIARLALDAGLIGAVAAK